MMAGAADDARARYGAKMKWYSKVICDDLSATAYRVAWRLADRANTELEAWPSEKRLAGELDTTNRSVRAALAVLRERGWIFLAQKGGKHIGSNRYRLNVDNASTARKTVNRKLASGGEESAAERQPEDPRHLNRKLASGKPIHRTFLDSNQQQQTVSAREAAAVEGGFEKIGPHHSEPDRRKQLDVKARVDAAKDDGVRRHVQRLVEELGATPAEAWSITLRMLDGDGPEGAWSAADQFMHFAPAEMAD